MQTSSRFSYTMTLMKNNWSWQTVHVEMLMNLGLHLNFWLFLSFILDGVLSYWPCSSKKKLCTLVHTVYQRLHPMRLKSLTVSYRGVTVMSAVDKAFEYIFLSRMEPLLRYTADKKLFSNKSCICHSDATFVEKVHKLTGLASSLWYRSIFSMQELMIKHEECT